MNSRFKQRSAALAALVVGLAFGGSSAKADLTLTITEAGNATVDPSITIDSTARTFTFSGGGNAKSYDFLINGSNVSFTTLANGTFASGANAFAANNTVVSFVADGVTGTTTSFDNYVIKSLTATESQSPSGSSIADLTTDVGKKGGVSGNSPGGSGDDSLTISPSYAFNVPSNSPNLLLKSTLNPTSIGNQSNTGAPSTVSFVSKLNTTSTATLSDTSAVSKTTSILVPLPGSLPYTVSNSLVITRLLPGNTDVIKAQTDVLPTPEPATLAMALTVLPAAFLLRRRRKSA